MDLQDLKDMQDFDYSRFCKIELVFKQICIHISRELRSCFTQICIQNSSFLLIWGIILEAIWDLEAPLWRYFGAHCVYGCTQQRPWVLQHRFSMIFDDSWVTSCHHFGVTFSQFNWFEASKNMFQLQARFFTIFDWTFDSFLMSQPSKNIVNTVVFIRFHFSHFLLIWMTSGTCLTLIWVTLESLGAPI